MISSIVGACSLPSVETTNLSAPGLTANGNLMHQPEPLALNGVLSALDSNRLDDC